MVSILPCCHPTACASCVHANALCPSFCPTYWVTFPILAHTCLPDPHTLPTTYCLPHAPHRFHSALLLDERHYRLFIFGGWFVWRDHSPPRALYRSTTCLRAVLTLPSTLLHTSFLARARGACAAPAFAAALPTIRFPVLPDGRKKTLGLLPSTLHARASCCNMKKEAPLPCAAPVNATRRRGTGLNLLARTWNAATPRQTAYYNRHPSPGGRMNILGPHCLPAVSVLCATKDGFDGSELTLVDVWTAHASRDGVAITGQF